MYLGLYYDVFSKPHRIVSLCKCSTELLKHYQTKLSCLNNSEQLMIAYDNFRNIYLWLWAVKSETRQCRVNTYSHTVFTP